jgi:UDP-N-acetylglucosamine--N-acetylmuramyl-(pentapeptide) pyrophosphoryl-undecaprenol N-acetylglucosamine transferase
MSAKHVVIMAAGTGGHIIPGLAAARELQARGYTVSWLGTTQGMENRLLPATGIPMDVIDFNGLRGKGAIGMLTGGLRLLHAFWQCLHILRARQPTAVLGMGGYVCFPGGMMASLLGKPLMLVNADAALLLSNKWLLPVTDRIAFGLPGADAAGIRQAVVCGNPVRQEITQLAVPEQRFAGRSGPLKVLVVGGSSGAKVLNETVPKALASMPESERPRLIHQTGTANFDVVNAAYASLGLQADVRPFIDDMAHVLAECDVIVCRAGAITVSELCAAGVASVLVPLVIGTTSHQQHNAKWLAGQDAAIHLPQTEFTPERLAAQLRELTRERLLALASKARTLAQPDSAARVCDELDKLVRPA